MAIKGALLDAMVVHTRHYPRIHNFKHRVYYLCLALSELPLIKHLRLLSFNRFNIFSLRESDYGDHKPELFKNWIPTILQKINVSLPTDRITLITVPKLFGYAFNPITFWCCFDDQDHLRGVVCEVNNTFGEKHCYLCAHDDNRPIDHTDVMTADKVFHVSPFFEIKGHYTFQFNISARHVVILINYFQDNLKVLSTSLIGQRHILNDRNLMKRFFQIPFVTFKIMVMIHYQALKLWLKKIAYFKKPPPPQNEVTR